MKRKAILLVMGIFLIGIALGAAGTYVAMDRVIAHDPRAPRVPPRMVDVLTKELGLDAEQQVKLSAIFEETKNKYQAMYESIRPQKDEIRMQGRQKIRGILTAEQQVKFEQFLQRIDAERKNRNHQEKQR